MYILVCCNMKVGACPCQNKHILCSHVVNLYLLAQVSQLSIYDQQKVEI